MVRFDVCFAHSSPLRGHGSNIWLLQQAEELSVLFKYSHCLLHGAILTLPFASQLNFDVMQQ